MKHIPLKQSCRKIFLGAILAILIGATPAAKGAENACEGGVDLAFVNGKIHTMDGQNRVVSAVLIRNGRFASVGCAPAMTRASRTCQRSRRS